MCASAVVLLCVFFFKQKTAYEMRISDWSSDVCSSDLPGAHDELDTAAGEAVPDSDRIAALERGEFRAPRRQLGRWFSVRHDKVQSKGMKGGPPSGADAFDLEPEGIAAFAHELNMRDIDPRIGRAAGDQGLRTECLGPDR